MRVLAILCAAVAGVAAIAPLTQQTPISVGARQRLTDMYGREVVYHGANVVVKGFPWYPSRGEWTWDTSFVAKDMEVMQELGMNAIRLGTMWPGAEPTRGAYNMTYIAELAAIVREASTYGISSLMDMHQDVMSAKFCGEGVPLWAVHPNTTDFPWPMGASYNKSANGVPLAGQCDRRPWMEYYFTKATGEAFQNLYDNYNGLRDAWGGFWQAVAGVTKDLGAAVLGYELINEPWAGDVFRDPLLMAPGVADALNLGPAYESVQAALRSVDATHAIFFEGVTWDWFNVGFKRVPGGDAWRNKSVLSYHFYLPPDFSLDVQFDARARDMQRLGCGGMLTEFGIRHCSGCGTIIDERVMDRCDAMMQSWLFWEFKPFEGAKTGYSSPIFFPNGSINHAQAFNVSRTFARAVAGVTDVMKFDLATGAFTLSYTVSAGVTVGVTDIYFSEAYHYPSGFNVSVVTQPPVAGVTYNHTARNTLHILHDVATVPAGTKISVQLTQ